MDDRLLPIMVSLALAKDEVPVPLGLRLFVPEAWAVDAARCAEAGIPEEHQQALAKTDIALMEIDRVIDAGARFGRVAADAGYGVSAAFRFGLSGRGLVWAVGIPKVQNVCATAVQLHWPKASTGRPRKHPMPSEDPVPADQALQHVEWSRISWRRGTKGPLMAEFAAVRVRPAEGEQLRQGRHLPGEEVWLVGEHRSSGERKYHLSNLPADATLEELAATIKARWMCGQAHQQMTEELGLDHVEGRSWTGLHRHALMTMAALCFLQHLRLKERGTKQGSRTSRATAATDPARRPPTAGRTVPPHLGLLPTLRQRPQLPTG